MLKTSHLNRLLSQAEGTDLDELINMSTLRVDDAGLLQPRELRAFRPGAAAYAHFTSPIRRYSDLIVHRALITAHGWGDDGLSPEDIERSTTPPSHISETERRSMMAERDTTDRYLAAFLSERVGTEIDRPHLGHRSASAPS